MHGFEGIGLLLAFAVCATSLSSFFGRRISFAWRFFFGSMPSVFFIGTIVEIQILQPAQDFSSYSEYVTFLISTSFFLLPHVLLGRGYPDLALVLCSKLRRRPQSEQGSPVE